MKSSGFCAGVGCNVLAVNALLFPPVFVGDAAALPADVAHALVEIIRVKLDVLPEERLVCSAFRAGYVPFLLRRKQIGILDSAVSLDGGSADHDGLVVPKGRLAFLCQIKGIALSSRALGVTVDLVRQQHLDGAAGKAGRAVCAHNGDVSAGKILLHDGVASVPALGIYKAGKPGRVPDHGSNAVFRDIHFENNMALPVISNQKMNDYLKELGELAEINEPVRETYYKGNERIDEVTPKYALLSTHAGRRTFICNALALGIPAQVVMKWTGHSDYKAMKPYIDIADDIKANAMNKFNQL